MFDLTSNALRPEGWTSADAAGLPIFPGLVRYDEVASGHIDHALRFTVSRTQRGVPAPGDALGVVVHRRQPAADGPAAAAARRASTSRGYTGQARVVLDALKKYGMIVADNGSNWFISGAADTRWNDDDLNQLKTVPGSAFEVVDTGESLHQLACVAARTVGGCRSRPDPNPIRWVPARSRRGTIPGRRALEPTSSHLVVVLGGVTIADTTRGYRVLETSHPPNYYFPPDDVRRRARSCPPRGARSASGRDARTTSRARPATDRGPRRHGPTTRPAPRSRRSADHVAFYAGRMDECFVDGERVVPQPGGFYGGWITSNVVGPFKGGPGSRGW